MPEKRYLIFDIETITDWNLVRSVFGLSPEATSDEIRTQVENRYSSTFLPAPFHIPICIALIDVDHESCRVQNAMVLSPPDEKVLLEKFWRIAKYRKGQQVQTVLVHFNGRCFDLPVLFYRSLKHRVKITKWDRNRYFIQNNKRGMLENGYDIYGSHDICDDLAEFGAAGRPSLNVIAKMIGLAGKTDVEGSKVEELYMRGEHARINDYCMDDTLTTYQIWLTIKLVRGELNEEKYREAFDSAPETIRNCRTLTDSFSNA